MKRILFVCCMLAFGCTAPFVQQATAQGPVTITLATFTTKVNQLDAFIAAGNMPQAKLAFDDLNQTMMIVAGKSKNDINTAATPADRAHYTAINTNQMALYDVIWGLKSNLTTNRAALHTKLTQFGATIY